MKPLINETYKDYSIRTLRESDVGERYLQWVTDKDVTKFLEIRHNRYKLQDIVDYVRSFEGDEKRFLVGIFDRRKNLHIGNATIYDINYYHQTFNFGLLIGDKDYWGGEASIAAMLMLFKFSFETLGLRKFFGQGVYANHIKSRFILKKLGCVEEARLIKKLIFEGQEVDQVIYTLDRDGWRDMKVKFGV